MWERNINQLLPVRALTRDGTHNLDMCPDQGSNPQPFGVQDNKTMLQWTESNLYFLIPSPFHPAPQNLFPSGNCQNVVCIYESGCFGCLFLLFFIFHTFFIEYFYCWHYADVPIPPSSLPASTQLPPSGNHHIILHVLGYYIYILCLISAFFHPVPHPHSPPTAVSLCTMYPCLWFYFVCFFIGFHIQVRSYIWHLSSTNWLISLSIILSRSIHAVAKGKISFFICTSEKWMTQIRCIVCL